MKVGKKLASWKKNYISLGGCITLIKAVLSNLLTYYMSVFSMLVKVVKKIKQMQRTFLWVGGDSKKDLLSR